LPDYLDQHRVVRAFGKSLVKLKRQLADICVSGLLHPEFDLLVDPTQTRTLGCCCALGSNARGKLIQRSSDREDLEDLFLWYPPHDKATPNLSDCEALRFEAKDCLADWRSADAKLGRQLLLAEPIARSELPDEDCLAERGICRIGRTNRPGVLLPELSEWCWPVSLAKVG
jgi:hypothetical protein